MKVEAREIAVAAAGFCAFLNLYSPQALLPALSREFGVGAAEISAIMTASTLAIALTAPFTGALADVLGRKLVIATAMFAVVVPMAGAALAVDVPGLIAWRFLQGLLLPPIFAVIIAYIGDEWPAAQVANAAGIYFAGSSLGGLCGRFIPGVLGDLVGWRSAFLALVGLSLAGAVIVVLLLPPETRFVRSHGFGASSLQLVRHIGNLQLLSAYGIGFGVLFNYMAVFTYVSFHLAAPPYSFSSTLLGAIFITYLIGTLLAPVTGRIIARLGRRACLLAAIAIWACGSFLTLAPPVAAIVAGLTVCAGCGMVCQTVATSYVTTIAREGRSSAVGLYVTSFYVGGSMGAFLPGLAWNSGGWPACVAMVIAMLAGMAGIAALTFARSN
ncbi:MAG TPA: MFS transporter [Xanthobacteraceae bacterium]|jgi:predicted MFS family arabinose efflux permease